MRQCKWSICIQCSNKNYKLCRITGLTKIKKVKTLKNNFLDTI